MNAPDDGTDRSVRTSRPGSLRRNPGLFVSGPALASRLRRSRTTHLHFKVFDGARMVLTSQLFLPDAVSEYLHTNLPAYRRATLRDTLNRGDGIALGMGDAAFGAVRETGDGDLLTATAVVDHDAIVPGGL